MSSLLTVPNDDSGILSVNPGRRHSDARMRNWDQKLSSGVLLTFMTTHLFLFRFADTEQYWVLTMCCAQSCLFSLASTFHRPPTLLRGFLRSVPFCTALYRAAGCGVSTPRRGTTDAHSSPRAKKVVVHMHRTTRHRERAPHELRARTHGAHV